MKRLVPVLFAACLFTSCARPIVWLPREWSEVQYSREIVADGGAVRSGATVTITTKEAYLYLPGEKVRIQGVADSSFDGIFDLRPVDPKDPQPRKFLIDLDAPGPDATSGGGKVTPLYRLPTCWNCGQVVEYETVECPNVLLDEFGRPKRELVLDGGKPIEDLEPLRDPETREPIRDASGKIRYVKAVVFIAPLNVAGILIHPLRTRSAKCGETYRWVDRPGEED